MSALEKLVEELGTARKRHAQALSAQQAHLKSADAENQRLLENIDKAEGRALMLNTVLDRHINASEDILAVRLRIDENEYVQSVRRQREGNGRRLTATQALFPFVTEAKPSYWQRLWRALRGGK